LFLLLFAEILAARQLDRNFCIWCPNNFPAISPSILVRFAWF